MRFFIKAFTLAEVLITLAVIGVVAALTIPSVISRNNEVETVAKVKKAYSTLSQAYNMAIVENGNVESWATEENGADIFFKHLKIMKNCGTSSGCWHKGEYENLSGEDFYDMDPEIGYKKARLIDGTSLAYYVGANLQCQLNAGTGRLENSVCADIIVDINGDKGPNVLGKDYFGFWITKTGIIPQGVQDDTHHSLEAKCSSKNTNGDSCAGWVVLKGNQDYLKRQVSWDE